MTEELAIRVKRRIDPDAAIWDAVDEQVRDIIEDVEARLRMKLGGVERVPEGLGYIVVDVSAKMYNRIGSEGASSHTVAGETLAYEGDMFAEYADEIMEWRSAHKAGHSHVRFI